MYAVTAAERIIMKLKEMKSGCRAAGYSCPHYDVDAMRERTEQNPVWIHFGAGNIFRAFHAAAMERMLNAGEIDRGVIVCESFDTEIIDRAYAPYDNLSLLVVLRSDGTIEKNVIGSVAAAWKAVPSDPDFAKLQKAFENPSLQMVTYTVTEKGYAENSRDAMEDCENMTAPKSVIGKTAKLLYHRFLAGALPLALVSTDNCSHNGDKLRVGVLAIVNAWKKNGFVGDDFLAYVSDTARVSFPWSMIDKITPRPDARVSKMLEADGFKDTETIVTSFHTYTAPFVNAEETEYLVIEDNFPNGRPALEKAGFIFTDRTTVDRVERMKVCTCLNPLHTAMAIFGCLLGFDSICGEMSDPDILSMIRQIGYVEGMPVVTDPGIIRPLDFIDTVVNVRLPNPFMPDTPQRIATDTTQKLSIRFGETIKAYMASDHLHVQDLKCIPLVLAGWIRYAMGVDDQGKAFERSPDPRFSDFDPIISQLQLGNSDFDADILAPIYTDVSLFGVDLCQAGLDEKVTTYLRSMLRGAGAVRETLHHTVND